MHSDKKRCADTLSLSRQAEQNRAEERVSIDTKKGSKYNKSNEKRGGGIQLKKRKWKFRIAGGAVTLLGIYLMAVGYRETITLTIATVVLIFGIAIWSMATPESYNSMTDMIAMISMEKPRKIEEFYEAYKNVDTPFGSAWLAKFYTMRQKALVFGPDAKGEYLYFWLTKDGHVGYLGYSFIEGFIKKKLTTPVYPIHEDVAENLADHLSYHSDLMMFQSELKANLEHFVKTGTVQPFQKISASQIYTFTEDYRLTGQHFDLEDTDGNLVYEIDSTVPLKTFYIYDAMHTEIFRMTKELLHALPTYRGKDTRLIFLDVDETPLDYQSSRSGRILYDENDEEIGSGKIGRSGVSLLDQWYTNLYCAVFKTETDGTRQIDFMDRMAMLWRLARDYRSIDDNPVNTGVQIYETVAVIFILTMLIGSSFSKWRQKKKN